MIHTISGHKILHSSFSSTESGTCSYHFSLHSRWNLFHSSQCIFFATSSCLFWYWFFWYCNISTFSLQSLQCGVSLVLLMLYFTELVLIACSCAAQKRFSVSRFSSPFLNYSCFLLLLWNSIFFTVFPCSAFCFHSLNRFSFFSFFLTLTIYFSKLSSAATVLTRASFFCAAYFARLHFFSSTLSLTLTRLLPPSFLGMWSLPTHDLGWSPPWWWIF